MKYIADTHTVFLLLGSNLGERAQHIENAIVEMELKGLKVQKKSALYETEAWGVEHQDKYLNQVIEIETSLHPFGLLDCLKEIEKNAGRIQKGDYQPRTIDLDILFFDELRLESSSLTIPHPRLHQRQFTLQPLLEIAPQWVHPVFNETVETLVARCLDELEVIKCS